MVLNALKEHAFNCSCAACQRVRSLYDRAQGIMEALAKETDRNRYQQLQTELAHIGQEVEILEENGGPTPGRLFV